MWGKTLTGIVLTTLLTTGYASAQDQTPQTNSKDQSPYQEMITAGDKLEEAGEILEKSLNEAGEELQESQDRAAEELKHSMALLNEGCVEILHRERGDGMLRAVPASDINLALELMLRGPIEKRETYQEMVSLAGHAGEAKEKYDAILAGAAQGALWKDLEVGLNRIHLCDGYNPDAAVNITILVRDLYEDGLGFFGKQHMRRGLDKARDRAEDGQLWGWISSWTDHAQDYAQELNIDITSEVDEIRAVYERNIIKEGPKHAAKHFRNASGHLEAGRINCAVEEYGIGTKYLKEAHILPDPSGE